MDMNQREISKPFMTRSKITTILQVKLLVVILTNRDNYFACFFFIEGVMMWDAGDAKHNNNFGGQIRNQVLS